MEQEAGDVVSIFNEKYIRPAIQGIEEIEVTLPRSISLTWTDQAIEISDNSNSYVISRQ